MSGTPSSDSSQGPPDAAQLARLLGAEALPSLELDEGLSEEEPWHVGDCLSGKYRVFGLTEGGFGRVLFADHAETGERYALKTLRRQHLRNAETVRRFAAEAARWLQLGMHPHVVRCYGIEWIAAQPFVVIEYVAGGRTLMDEILGGPADWRRLLRMALPMAQALAYCERVAGLIHGDIKPLNILITPEGGVKVTDFGISYARFHETDASPQAGTPGYCAPELLEGGRRSTASDIYAFGMTLWQCASGTPPRTDTGAAGAQPDAAAMVADMPQAFAALIMDCVSPDPADRPASFAQLANDLILLHQRLLGESALDDLMDPRLMDRCEAAANAHNLSDAFLTLENYGLAAELARRAIEIDPDYWLGHDALARALIGLQRNAEAVDVLATALALAPADPQLHALLALARMQAGLDTDARTALREAIRLARAAGTMGCLDMASTTIVTLLTPEEAVVIHDEIIRANPTANSAWINRTAILRLLNRDEDALANARDTVDLYPASALAWGALSSVLTDLGEDGAALEAIERALSYDAATPSLHAQKCIVLFKIGRPEDGRQQLVNALSAWPDSATLRQLAGLSDTPLGNH